MMAVTVEFFGIPRSRAGLETTIADGETLGEVLTCLAARFPELAKSCIDGDRLRLGFIANLGGDRFISDPATRLAEDCVLLLLSQDAGG
jgi:molybdopterin converting factor small subunit